MTAIQKKVVFDERGEPVEVVIPWAQFCELSEALGLDLDEAGREDLRATREDLASGDSSSFIPLSAL